MTQIKQANGYRLHSLAHLFSQAINPSRQPKQEDVEYDLDRALSSVVSLRSQIPDDAYTAAMLGTEREGQGIVIDDEGLLLTIGYLVAEADKIMLASLANRVAEAVPVAYDYETGFGLVRAVEPLDAPAMTLGAAANVHEGEEVVVAGYGGAAQSVRARIVSKRPFAGYWEYMLDEAIFTIPAHPNWGGTALIAKDGTLSGVGSLFVQDALPGGVSSAGNMFVPIDLLRQIMDDLMRHGHANRPPRPWLGMFTTEVENRLVIAGVANGGPAERDDVRVGDIVVHIDAEPVFDLLDLWRKIWSLGSSGVVVRLTLLRDGEQIDKWVRSANRYDYMKLPRAQ
ncbi:MAG: S1C family serine protease [Alphaproteobacteria bacterium]